jgi:hypothetical protein
MVRSTQNCCLDSVHWICFRPQVKRWEGIHSVRSITRANSINGRSDRITLSKGPKRLGVSPAILPGDGSRSSFS